MNSAETATETTTAKPIVPSTPSHSRDREGVGPDGAGPRSSSQWRDLADAADAADWDAVRADLDAYGCALTGPLLTPQGAAEIAGLYPDDSRFRSTIGLRDR